MDIFVSNKSNTDDIKLDMEEEDGENLDLLIANSYFDMIAMTTIYQREKDILNCLELTVLSYLYYFLHIADDVGEVTI